MKVAMVTGAGAGSIGEATAVALRGVGFGVLTTTRSCPVAADSHPLDLTSRVSVEELAAWVGSSTDRLDVLGTAHLTRLLLPRLLETADAHGEARVVEVVSQLHERGRNAWLDGCVAPYDSWAAYGTSKLALVHEAAEIERRYGERGLHGYAVHPGSVYTHVADRGLETAPILGRLRRLAAPLERRALLTPVQGRAHHRVLRDVAGRGTGGLPPPVRAGRAVTRRPRRRSRGTPVGQHIRMGRGLDRRACVHPAHDLGRHVAIHRHDSGCH